MSDFVGLEEIDLVVENFAEEYGGDWSRLKAEVEGIGRTDEHRKLATAKVHVILKDEDCDVIGDRAFWRSKNLWKVTAMHALEVGVSAFSFCKILTEATLPAVKNVAEGSFSDCRNLTNVRLPNATSIGVIAFFECYTLRHVTLHPTVAIATKAFISSTSLEVLATCAGFELDTGDRYHYTIRLDPSVAITNYLKSQNELDRQQRDVFLTYNLMLALCNHHIDKKTGKKTGDIRAWPEEHELLANFLFNNEDPARHILSFFGMNWGEHDLRKASKQRLLEIGLQKKVLREETNEENGEFWGVKVNEDGEVVSRRGDIDWFSYEWEDNDY